MVFILMLITGVLPLQRVAKPITFDAEVNGSFCNWPDASARVNEQEMTAKLEGLFSSVKGIKEASSVSSISCNLKLMNKHFSILLLFLLCKCSATVNGNDFTIIFTQTEHKFASLSFTQEASYSFAFFTPWQSPLIIFDVKTSYGYTLPDWTKTPIKPGRSVKITVIYDAAFQGTFHKEVSVFSNDPDSPAKLESNGQVEYPDDLDTGKWRKKEFHLTLLGFFLFFSGIYWLAIPLFLLAGISLLISPVRLPQKNKKWSWLKTAFPFIGVFFIAIFVRVFLVEIFSIPSGSMEDTLLPGGIVLTNKLAYGPKLPVSPYGTWTPRLPPIPTDFVY